MICKQNALEKFFRLCNENTICFLHHKANDKKYPLDYFRMTSESYKLTNFFTRSRRYYTIVDLKDLHLL